jgi:biofilm PGA synthesis N-glycosyltransferase PgaC
VLVGILAHNEEKNIGRTVDFLARRYPTYRILVVSSGSTDRTDEIVRQLAGEYSNVALIVEPERRGKTYSLISLLRTLNEQYDVLVFLGADDMPEDGAIDRLVATIGSEDRVGLVGGRPIPLNDATNLAGWITHLIWDVHHTISLVSPKVSGELCALRAGVVFDAPPTLINDDAYLQFMVALRGFEIAYEPEAVVHLRGPETIRDHFTQRCRVTIGHYQIEQLLGAKLPTTNARRNVPLAWGIRKRVGLARECCWFLFFLMLSALIVGRSWFDFNIARRIPYKWTIVRSTKKLA